MKSKASKGIAGVMLSIMLGFFTASAYAADFCSDINRLIQAAPGNFSTIIVKSDERLKGRDITLIIEGASECTVRQMIRSKSYGCTWTFQLGDPRAYARFDALGQAVQRCIGDRGTLNQDQNVNHPDFYDSRIFLLDTAKVSVSVKDKSALESTFVFLFVEPRTKT
ncbi:MAG: hypothetical protein AAGA73_11720 [Pseudomonadota bacterium]